MANIGTVDIAVVIPVMNRPHRAAPVMASLRETTSRARCYAITHSGDDKTASAWLAAGANVLTASGSSYPAKVNHAYRNTGEPWLFICGDDVRFHPGWADELLRVVAMVTDRTGGHEPAVIGANDLCNPRVMAGTHATHFLISRRYIAQVGASWDGPGVVCHEGYRHMFVDDEIVTKAKQQPGMFAVAKDSVVEHLHPVAGKAAMDEVYELGASFMEQDRALFAARMQANSA